MLFVKSIVRQVDMVRYDTIAEFNETQKLSNSALSSTCSQKKNVKKEETKTKNRQCPFNSVQVNL